MKMTSNEKRPQNIQRRISQQPMIGLTVLSVFPNLFRFDFFLWLHLLDHKQIIKLSYKFQTGQSSKIETKPCLPYHGMRRHKRNGTPA